MTIEKAQSYIGCHVEIDKGESAMVIGVDSGGTNSRVEGVWVCVRQRGQKSRWANVTDRETL